jgi:hypothetical protein
MKSTLVVLALAVVSTTGCRAIGPTNHGPGCGDACSDSCGEPCHITRNRNAPRPMGYAGGPGQHMGRGGSLEANCPGGGDGCLFGRYTGQECGPGYHPGPYDCSPCNSPNWGCTGHQHPQGYVNGEQCMCQSSVGPCSQCKQPGPQCPMCGHGYCCACCGPPAPGSPCCPCCGASGDQNYNFNPGPPTGQTAYPYYTLRGPRDYLLGNPPSIGPY